MGNMMALASYQFRLFRRDFLTLFFALAFPVLMFIIFSNLFGSQEATGGVAIQQYLVPSYIPIIIINTLFMSFGLLMVTYKEHGYFLKYKVMGLNPIQVAISIFLAVIILQLFGIGLLAVMAVITKGITIPFGNMVNVTLTIVLINLFEFAIAFFLSALFLKARTYQALALILFYFQMFLGGLTFPPEMFGNVLRNVMEIINPVIYGLYMMRGVWVEGASFISYGKEILILTAISVVFIAAGTKLFRWNG